MMNDYNFSYQSYLEKSIKKETKKQLEADPGLLVLLQKNFLKVDFAITE